MSTLADQLRVSAIQAGPTKTKSERATIDVTNWLTGAAFLVFYYAAGLWLVLEHGVLGDAYKRVANAHFVMFSRDPHLEAIGFIWTPLPSLLSIPLVALKTVWPELTTDGIASVVISTVAATLSVLIFRRILKRFGFSPTVSWLLALFYGLNPFVIYYAANGMSEMLMVLALLGATDNLIEYFDTENLASLGAASLWMSAGFMIRYEVLVWAVAIGVVLMIWYGHREPQADASKRWRNSMVGRVILLLSPLTWVATVWIFFNWVIMKDPLFFLRSSYGNTAIVESSGVNTRLADEARGSIVMTLDFFSHQFLLYVPVILVLAGLCYLVWRGDRAERGAASLVLVGCLALPVLQIAMLYQGTSFGWLRYFMTIIPFGILGLALFARHLQKIAPRFLTIPALLAIVLVGNGGTYLVMASDSDYFVTEPLAGFEEPDRVVEYLNLHPNDIVLADTFLTSSQIVLRANNSKQFVVTSDRDFHDILMSPYGQIDAILVPSPNGAGALDAVNLTYPGLWAGEAEWTQMLAEFPGEYRWRLYRVLRNPNTAP